MAILTKDPHDICKYTRWKDGYEYYDIWYDDSEIVYVGSKEKLPSEFAPFMEKWIAIIEEQNKDPRELYPVKHAKINFIYGDKVYRMLPCAVHAKSDFVFEMNQREIRDDLIKTFGIKYTNYFGMLD